MIIYVDVVGRCNLKCPSCPIGNTAHKHHVGGAMSINLLSDILKKAVGESEVTTVGLYNWTEPLLHPQIGDLIRIVKSYGLGCLMSSNLNISKNLDDVVLNPKTRETLDALLKQVDKEVVTRLKAWGIKDKKKGIEARIIFYGDAGTGKTLTSLALAKSLKKEILSFDCSKILSMYVGESEKNVRNIFDTYKDLSAKTKSEPILLLNEADQFLSSRTSDGMSGSEKMHNQMQNIFLEQIERFDGILIATTNLLENIDKAFSRRFNYKIEFSKPNLEQREQLWTKLLPDNLPLAEDFDVKKLYSYELTGGQIELIIKNTAFKIAVLDNPIFKTLDFVEQIDKELKSQFDSENKVGFFS